MKDEVSHLSVDDSCVMTLCNWIECLEENTCLCLALSIGRTEACAINPAQLQVKDILPSMISAQSFLESIDHKTRGDSGDVSIHGGFERYGSADGFVSGVARDKITGILVLYIHPENWKVARLFMNPVYSYMCTLDILHYSNAMSNTIPFLVLEALLKKETMNSFIHNRLSLTI